MKYMLMHDLEAGDIDFPEEIRSDVGKLGFMLREYDLTIDEFEQMVDSYLKTYGEKGFMPLWKRTINDYKRNNQYLVKNLEVLDTKMRGPRGQEYAAEIRKKKDYYSNDKYTVYFLARQIDDQWGNMTGQPNEEYWAGTPGQYYASTLLDYDDFGSPSRNNDEIVIDGGSNWTIYGTKALKDEIEEKYGHEIRNEVNESTYSANRAKKVYENLKGI